MKKKNARLICAGGTFDHIHLYASLLSTISIADFVNAMKSNSSRWIHESFSTRKGFAWQEGYGAFSVSKSDGKKVIKYIRNQRQHHAKRSFKDEYLEFLIQNLSRLRREIFVELKVTRTLIIFDGVEARRAAVQ